MKNTQIKHLPTGMIFNNRKDAKERMGRKGYNDALKNREFEMLGGFVARTPRIYVYGADEIIF